MNFSNEVNGSRSTFPETGDSSNLGLSVVYFVASVLVMVANGTIVVIVVKTKELHLPTLWLITNMAVWDLLYGFYFLVFVAPSAFYNQFAYSDGLISLVSSLHVLLGGQNLLNTSFMVADRYMAMKWPRTYANIAKKTNYMTAGFVTMVINVGRLLCQVLPNFKFQYNTDNAICTPEFNSLLGKVAFVIFAVVSYLIIIVCSVQTSLEIFRSRRQVRPQGRSVDAVSKFSLMVTLSATAFCIWRVPALVAVVMAFVRGRKNMPPMLIRFSVVCLHFNSVLNVFIYSVTYTPFREALLSAFCRSYYRRRNQTETQLTFRDLQNNQQNY